MFNEQSIKYYVHAISKKEIENDQNEERKKISLTKRDSYPVYDDYLNPYDNPVFINLIGESQNDHDRNDAFLLYSLYHNAFEFLITEDNGIHHIAKKTDLADRVLSISEALILFKKFESGSNLLAPHSCSRFEIESVLFA